MFESLGGLSNLDLLSVGIATASIGILGFVVFLNNRFSLLPSAYCVGVKIDFLRKK